MILVFIWYPRYPVPRVPLSAFGPILSFGSKRNWYRSLDTKWSWVWSYMIILWLLLRNKRYICVWWNCLMKYCKNPNLFFSFRATLDLQHCQNNYFSKNIIFRYLPTNQSTFKNSQNSKWRQLKRIHHDKRIWRTVVVNLQYKKRG